MKSFVINGKAYKGNYHEVKEHWEDRSEHDKHLGFAQWCAEYVPEFYEKEKSFSDSLFEQAATITKAHAYDILVEQVKELKAQNEMLQSNLNAEKQYSSLQFDELKHVKELNRELIEVLKKSNERIHALAHGADSEADKEILFDIHLSILPVLAKANSINQ